MVDKNKPRKSRGESRAKYTARGSRKCNNNK